MLRLPASLITAHGGQVVSNNGGTVISNNSGNYRLLALEQVGWVGAKVRVVDADGKSVLDAAGQALEVTTDAQGRFAFPAIAHGGNWLLEAQLPDGQGRAAAILGPGKADGQQAEIDLASSLVARYIMDRYVRPQDDKQVTLDRLPGDVERETRERTAAALSAEAAIGVSALTDGDIGRAVDGLRQQNSDLDRQMIKVRDLLIAAGQSNLGSGRPGQTVRFLLVSSLAAGPHDEVYFTSGDHQLWRLDATNRVEAVVGSAAAASPNVPLYFPNSLTFDPDGNAFWIDQNNLYRRDIAGRVTTLAAGRFVAAFARPGGEVLACLTSGSVPGGNFQLEIKAIGADGKASPVATVTGEEAAKLAKVKGMDADGRLWSLHTTGQSYEVLRWQPGQQGVTPVTFPAGWPQLDPHGNIFVETATGALSVVPVGQPARTLHSALLSLATNGLECACLLPNGQALIAFNDGQIFRLADGAAVPLAGQGINASNNAADLGLASVNGLAVASDGAVFVSDPQSNRVVRIEPDGSKFADLASGKWKNDFPTLLRTRGSNTYVTGYGGISRFDGTGLLETLFKPDGYVFDYQVTGDGHVYVSYRASNEVRVARVAPGGVPEVISSKLEADYLGTVNYAVLALGPDDALLFYERERGSISRWTPAEGLAQLVADDQLKGIGVGGGGLAAGPDGRLYATSFLGQVLRLDLDHAGKEVVAGKGSKVLAGSGVDDGLSQPTLLSFGPDGSLYVGDTGYKQVKRIPAAQLR